MSIAFFKTNVKKNLVILRLPPLQLVVENGFRPPILRQPKIFSYQAYDDQKIFVSIFSMCHHSGLAIYMKEYLKAKKIYGNSNISPCKNIILRKKIL